ncbi:hypothetical protein SAMN05880590_10177 [Rhizobium sp. RU35A]|uniref:hypothetical protein n=1 Tax=Rhizobium sp. RU35A TaxID=1907414 RepID=UPI000955DD1D|nr:hypothetical protein [Rhizobium sp. RU35A]SIP89866.1 hypothetical protein SAMN05880590_10177 [Rhizobium sp. RU35A]
MTDIKKLIGGALALSREASQQLGRGVADIRSHIVALKLERKRIAALPVDQDETFARIDRLVDVATEAARQLYPTPADMVRPDYQPKPVALKPELLLLAQMGAEIGQRMKAEALEFYKANPGLDAATRADRIRSVDRKILDAELAEESMIRSAEAAGFPILRRRDADPRAVLAHEKVLPQ